MFPLLLCSLPPPATPNKSPAPHPPSTCVSTPPPPPASTCVSHLGVCCAEPTAGQRERFFPHRDCPSWLHSGLLVSGSQSTLALWLSIAAPLRLAQDAGSELTFRFPARDPTLCCFRKDAPRPSVSPQLQCHGHLCRTSDSGMVSVRFLPTSKVCWLVSNLCISLLVPHSDIFYSLCWGSRILDSVVSRVLFSTRNSSAPFS